MSTVILRYYDTVGKGKSETINNLSQYNVAEEINILKYFVANATVLLDDELLK